MAIMLAPTSCHSRNRRECCRSGSRNRPDSKLGRSPEPHDQSRLSGSEFWDVLGGCSDDAELSSCRPWPSDHRDQFALSVAVAVDVPLRGLDRAMACQQLDIAERT